MRDYQRDVLIDYVKIAQGVEHYEKLGFVSVPTPWVVGPEAYHITFPGGVAKYETLGGFLVSSGEVGFLQKLLQGETFTRAQTTTPCFRDEDHDELHWPYFLKTELFSSTTTAAEVDFVTTCAYKFFSRFLDVEVVETDDGFDIEASGIELGSYGIRSHGDLAWVYGTGLAEPRFSYTIEQSLH